MATLRVLPPVDRPWTVALGDDVIVGRREPADVVVPDALVSRRHCRIRRDGDAFTVEDLGSANGTFVDGKRVEGVVRLERGARIELGFWAIRLESDSIVTTV